MLKVALAEKPFPFPVLFMEVTGMYTFPAIMLFFDVFLFAHQR